MIKRCLIFYFCLFFSFCLAIPSALPAEPDNELEEFESAEISGERKLALLEFSLTSASGNSEALTLFTGTELFYKSSGNSIGFDGNFYYGESSGVINVRSGEGRLMAAHDFNITNYGYLLGTLKHDEFQRLNLRTSLGIGYGYRLISNPYEELSVEGGIGLQGEDFSGSRKDDYYHEGRIGINYNYNFSKTARFVTKDEYLPSLSGISNYRIRGEFKLIESLYKNLAVILNLILDYDGSPVEDKIKNLDTRIFAGVGYNFF
ncbi:MAG: DUF481 domain-containing protein [Nitrospinota bacterium]